MLGEALRLIRVFHDKSQKQLAEEFEVAQSYISELEKGKKQPTLSMLEKYSRYFDIPGSSILFFSESIERGKFSERARAIVSKKVLRILDFIAERAGRNDEDKD